MKRALFVILLILLVNTPLFLRIRRTERGREVGGTLPLTIQLQSKSFSDGNRIDKKHTCFGANQSPHIAWQNIPQNTKSIALIITDYDVPHPNFPFTDVVHWLVVNIPPDRTSIDEGFNHLSIHSDGILQGRKEMAGFPMGHFGYHGSCPKMGSHAYYLRVYALSEKLVLPQNMKISREWFYRQIRGRILAVGQSHWQYP